MHFAAFSANKDFDGRPLFNREDHYICVEHAIYAVSAPTSPLAIFSDTLAMRPALLYSDTQSVVGFSVIRKCVTSSNLEWLFGVKFCFRAGSFDRATFEILVSLSGSIRFMRIL